MPELQIKLGIFSKDYGCLTGEEKRFLDYFIMIRESSIEPVMRKHYSAGPKGYGTSLILTRMLKIKERISADRELASGVRVLGLDVANPLIFSDKYPNKTYFSILKYQSHEPLAKVMKT